MPELTASLIAVLLTGRTPVLRAICLVLALGVAVAVWLYVFRGNTKLHVPHSMEEEEEEQLKREEEELQREEEAGTAQAAEAAKETAAEPQPAPAAKKAKTDRPNSAVRRSAQNRSGRSGGSHLARPEGFSAAYGNTFGMLFGGKKKKK